MSSSAVATEKVVKPYWYQEATLDTKARFVVMLGGTGGGKALACDTEIPTVRGFKNMADVVVGDEVFDSHGEPTRVVYVSPIYYEHKCYRLTFDDGTEVVADAEHLWTTQTRKQRKNEARHRPNPNPAWTARPQCVKGPVESVVTTEDIARTLKVGGALNHSIASVCIEPGNGHKPPIPPYTLGAWLGDGTSIAACITCADMEIIESIKADGLNVKVEAELPWSKASVYRMGGGPRYKRSHDSRGRFTSGNSLQGKLRRVGVLGDKHIPDEYLLASRDVRLSLLQGLLDTDGWCSGKCEISLSNERLAGDTLTLLAGLGIKAKGRRGKTRCADRWRMHFTTDKPVFRLTRKAEKLPKSVRPSTKRRFIVSCEPVDSVPVKCITVESETRSYLCTRHFITTHNSWFGPVWLSQKIEEDRKAGITDARYLALGPTSDMTRDQMLPYLVNHYKGTALEGQWQAQSRIYQLPTGGRIYFRSADKPLRIEGHHFRAAWVDEPAQMKAGIWPIIQGRTGYNKAQVLFTGYAVAQNWYYHDLFKPWEAGDKDYEVIQFKSTDNPAYPKDEYERAKATLPGWMFDMRYDGKFHKPAGLVYPEFGEHLFIEPFDIPAGWPVYVGLDPGVFFGGLFLAWHDGVYYAYSDYYNEILTPAAEHARELLARVRGELVAWIYDPARLTDVNELAQHGVAPLVKGMNAVLPGIAAVTAVIKSGRLKVMRGRCPALVDQMEMYSFPTDKVTGEASSENPIKKDDHIPDVLRYIIFTIEGAAEESVEESIITYSDPVSISPV